LATNEQERCKRTQEQPPMARRRIKKAARIRAILKRNPDASAKEIIATLAAQRVRVTPAHVYALKAKMSRPKAKQSANGYASLIEAKKLADALGGVAKAREALAVLANLL
jgi:hypothetical protein